ncbi:unnamed protein product, partial [Phaeothamnion confervicola]
MREVPAYGLYFAAYEGAKATLMDAGASHGLAAFVAGGECIPVRRCEKRAAVEPLPAPPRDHLHDR